MSKKKHVPIISPGRPVTWTPEKTIKTLQKMLKVVEEEPVYSLTIAAQKAGIKIKDWCYLNDKWGKSECDTGKAFSELKRAIEALVEAKIRQGILEQKINKADSGHVQTYTTVHPTSGIFVLKTKFGYVEKTYNENVNHETQKEPSWFGEE